MRKLFLVILLTLPVGMYAQLSTGEAPISFTLNEARECYTHNTRSIIMPELDMEKIHKDDAIAKERGLIPRFGYRHKVSYDLNNSGVWFKLPNGDKMWQFEIICPNALSINILYDKFWLPDGGKFFVYSSDKKYHIGAFTSRNNKGIKSRPRGFATGLIPNNDIVLEYYQPSSVSDDAIISIDCIVHGYRNTYMETDVIGSSWPCEVNINCDEGKDWQLEKRAVARIIANGNHFCTGALINNTSNDQKPYLLTANHCLDIWDDSTNVHYVFSADGIANLDYWIFNWNFESSGCESINVVSDSVSTHGATVIANNSLGDFALLQLDESPRDCPRYIPYYLGWDRSGNSGDPGVCIHHPHGAIKKISTVDAPPDSHIPTQYGFNYRTDWIVNWKATVNGHGVTEEGSSGSPLLNAEHRIIGQLHHGRSYCNSSYVSAGPDYFGAFDLSWSGHGASFFRKRLDHWLDPINTGQQYLDGLFDVTGSITLETSQIVYGSIIIPQSGHLTIKGVIPMTGNSTITIESGGVLTVDSGKLCNVDIIMEEGSSIEVTNGGIIETRNGFNAPLGSTVNIIHGQIL